MQSDVPVISEMWYYEEGSVAKGLPCAEARPLPCQTIFVKT